MIQHKSGNEKVYKSDAELNFSNDSIPKQITGRTLKQKYLLAKIECSTLKIDLLAHIYYS